MESAISLTDAAEAIVAGRVTPLELVEQCLARIDALEPRLHAWVSVDADGARRQAQDAARQVADARRRGISLPPLCGIPLAIKDVVDIAGAATQAGSPLRAGHVAAADAPVVARLRDAGAIVLGKTVTTEFACFDPSPTLNPWSPDGLHTPGGSSSGSAAAVAAGMCLGALGTQTGGSLVRPASYCGVAAWKPTVGRVPTDGVVPVTVSLDHVGAIAGSAADLAILAQALFVDGASSPDQPATPPRPKAHQSPRLGLLRSYFLDHADANVAAVFAIAADRLRAAGATVVEAALPPGFEHVHTMHRTIMNVEAAAYHREAFAAHRESFGPNLRGMLDEGLATDPAVYAAARRHLDAFRRTIDGCFGDVDAWITPATDTTAPHSLATTGNSRFQAPWSYAGTPVVSLSSGVAADGMPAAVQLIGRTGDDERLLAIAAWCEQWFDMPYGQPPRTGVY